MLYVCDDFNVADRNKKNKIMHHKRNKFKIFLPRLHKGFLLLTNNK